MSVSPNKTLPCCVCNKTDCGVYLKKNWPCFNFLWALFWILAVFVQTQLHTFKGQGIRYYVVQVPFSCLGFCNVRLNVRCETGRRTSASLRSHGLATKFYTARTEQSNLVYILMSFNLPHSSKFFAYTSDECRHNELTAATYFQTQDRFCCWCNFAHWFLQTSVLKEWTTSWAATILVWRKWRISYKSFLMRCVSGNC